MTLLIEVIHPQAGGMPGHPGGPRPGDDESLPFEADDEEEEDAPS